MKIRFYQAECGDASCISFIGSDNMPHNIFIDAGYERTFRHVLADEIQALSQKGEAIDLWILSHIHDDHIGGAIAYIKSINSGEFKDIVKSWLYNHPRKSLTNLRIEDTKSISETKSIGQGDYLASYLFKHNNLPSYDITNKHPTIDLFGLKITILSPDDLKLQGLRNKYPPESQKAYERGELDAISEAKKPPQYDYHIPITGFDFEQWQEDDSIENGSSIAVLSEYQDQRILWLADAHPNCVVNALNDLGYSKSNPLVCDWVKVTHHGSKGNNCDDLYDMIRCENYLISSNGENRNCLPTKECIARILRNKQRLPDSHYNIYFTYENELLRSIFKVDGEDIFKEFNFTTCFPSGNSKMIVV